MGDVNTKNGKKRKKRRKKKKKKEADPWQCYKDFVADVFKSEVIIVKKPEFRLSDYQFRSELRRLMGSEVIHLNDRKWNEELESRLRDEYEKRLDRHEESLAEAEVMRIRKLKLDGIISLTEEDVEDQENDKRKQGKSKGKRRKVKHRKRSPSPQNNKRCSSAPSRSVTFYRAPEEVPTQVELMGDTGSEKERKVDDDVTSGDVKYTSQQSPRERRDTRSPEREDPERHRSSSRFRRQVPEEIRELYEEESVDGLYTLAQRLVIDTSRKQAVQVKVESY